jgi:hypothetical protein
MEQAYRKLGGRFTGVADRIGEQRDTLLIEARRDIEDYADLIDAWPGLVAAARETPPPHA